MINEEKIRQFATFLKEEEKSENTLQKYISDIIYFNSWIKEKSYEINKNTLIDYKNYLKEKYKNINTINSKIASLNAFLKWEEKEHLKIKILKKQNSIFGAKDKELTKTDIRKIIKTCKNNDRLMNLIMTIMSTGIRVSEVKFITVEAIKEGRVVVENKGKNRTVIFTKKLSKNLLTFCRKNKIYTGAVFVTKNNKPLDRKNIWKMIKDISRHCDVDAKKLFPHNFRHYFAREFYKMTKDIVKLSSILGHSNINTTMIYAKETEDECRKSLEIMMNRKW